MVLLVPTLLFTNCVQANFNYYLVYHNLVFNVPIGTKTVPRYDTQYNMVLKPCCLAKSAHYYHIPISKPIKLITVAVWPDLAIYWTMGNFLKPLATTHLPKSPTFLGNFWKGVKSFLGTFYRHLAIFSGLTVN